MEGTVAKILIDMGSAVYCNTAVIVHSMRGTGHIRVYSGTTYYNWEFEGTMESGHVADADYGTSAIFASSTLGQYWGVVVDGPQFIGTGIKVYEVFLGKKLELSTNPVYPVQMGAHKGVSICEGPKGIRYIYRNFSRKFWDFRYEMISDGDKDDIKEMVDYCSGSHKPLWFTIDSASPSDTEFVRFVPDRFSYEEIISGRWRANISIEQEL